MIRHLTLLLALLSASPVTAQEYRKTIKLSVGTGKVYGSHGNTVVVAPNKRVSGTPNSPLIFNGPYKGLNDMTGRKDASGMVLDHFEMLGVQQRGINLESGNTVGFVARNGVIRARGGELITLYPMGIAVKNARETTFENLLIEGFTTRDTPGSKYKQGDGMTLEPNAKGVRTVNITVRGCMDGNLDSKAQGFVSTGYYTSTDGGYNFRLWYNSHTFENAISKNPVHGHFQLNSKIGRAAGLIAKRVEVHNTKNTAPIFTLSRGSTIDIREMVIDVLPGTKLFKFDKPGVNLTEMSVKLPRNVKVDANGFVVSTKIGSTTSR